MRTIYVCLLVSFSWNCMQNSTIELSINGLSNSASPSRYAIPNIYHQHSEKWESSRWTSRISLDKQVIRPIKQERKKYKKDIRNHHNTVKKNRKIHWANILAFISGILSFVIPFAFIVAISFGIIGIRKSGRKKDYAGLGLGIAGFVLGSLFAILVLIALYQFIT